MKKEHLYSGLDDLLQKCIHCGMCLPVCPTYTLTMREESSPRGRIRWMKGVGEGTLEISDAFAREMYFCLDCQACATACPAGVRYGALVEHARELIHEEGKTSRVMTLLKRLFLPVLASRRKTLFIAGLLRFYQRTGLREAVERSTILSVFSSDLHEKHALLPMIDPVPFDAMSPTMHAAVPPVRGTVAFVSGCVMNVAFGRVHEASVRVLQKCGFNVIIPARQGCCGSLHAHNGERAEATRLAKEMIGIFSKYQHDYIVVDSAGCGAFMKEYGEYLETDPDYAEPGNAFSSKVYDFSEFLELNGALPFRKVENMRVTYHDACHLVHSQRISRQPRELLKRIPGLEFIEMAEASWCCGSAGVYNIAEYKTAVELRTRKISHISATGANVVVTCNPGCQLQIKAGLSLTNLPVETLSLSEVLDKAL